MKTINRIVLVVACVVAASCASDAKDAAKPVSPGDGPAKAGKLPPAKAKEVYRPEDKDPSKPAKRKDARVTLDPAVATVGKAVRSAGEQAGGNIVLMNGVEDRILKDAEIKRKDMGDAAAALAAASGLAMENNPRYFFLFPEGYEQLVNVTLAGRLDTAYSAVTTDAVFGSGLPLYSVFMWMGYALRVSIVADQSVGEARCGEIALAQVPLDAALEAILKSARVPAVQCESTPGYIFLSAPSNTNPASALLDEASHGDKQKAILAAQVSLALPVPLRTGQPMELPLKSSRLGDVLPALSQQLGIRVVAERGLEKFPVNPFYLRDTTVRTAMDLLLRQWLEPNYGYQVLDDRIVIRTR